MEFCFAAVYRGKIPLVQDCSISGNFDMFLEQYTKTHTLDKGINLIISDTITHGIYLDENDLIFLFFVTGTEETDQVTRALEILRDKFYRDCGKKWETASTYELQSEFYPQIQKIKETIFLPMKHGKQEDLLEEGDFSSVELESLPDFQPIFVSRKNGNKFLILIVIISAILLIIILVFLLIIFKTK